MDVIIINHFAIAYCLVLNGITDAFWHFNGQTGNNFLPELYVSGPAYNFPIYYEDKHMYQSGQHQCPIHNVGITKY